MHVSVENKEFASLYENSCVNRVRGAKKKKEKLQKQIQKCVLKMTKQTN